MINEIRSKEEELVKEREEESAEWEQRLQEKEKVIVTTEQRRNFAKGELIKTRRQDVPRVIAAQVEEAAREKAHQEFYYDFEAVREKINKVQLDREESLRELSDSKYLKTGIIKDQLNRI